MKKFIENNTVFLKKQEIIQTPKQSIGAWDLDVIVLDPGHGGEDAGAISINGYKEKDIALSIAKKVKEAVASAQAAGPGFEITVSSANDEVFVLGDSMRIHQAIANLLANARTHTPAGTKIVVDILQDELETRISVSDTGPGLSESDQERAFERFFRADPSRVRVSGEGSGLGLAIVDAVMKAHGGSVEVKSKLGEGATFTIIFPQKEL